MGNYLEKILPVLGIRIISINDGFDSINSSGFTGGMSVALKNMLNAKVHFLHASQLLSPSTFAFYNGYAMSEDGLTAKRAANEYTVKR